MVSSGRVVAAETSRKSVITEKAGSSSVTRPGDIGSATRAPGPRRTSVRGEYSRMVPSLAVSARELGAAAEMKDRFLGAPDSLHQRGERHVSVVGRLEREARLDVALCLAPQSLARAQLPEREEERRIARMSPQPLLGVLDLRQRVASGGFPVERDEARAPLAFQRLFDDRLRFGRAAQGEVVARRGRRHRGIDAYLGGQLLP